MAAAWTVDYHTFKLALGEPQFTVLEAPGARITYGWDCGCDASTLDSLNCIIVCCDKHEKLFPAQTRLRPRDEG